MARPAKPTCARGHVRPPGQKCLVCGRRYTAAYKARHGATTLNKAKHVRAQQTYRARLIMSALRGQDDPGSIG